MKSRKTTPRTKRGGTRGLGLSPYEHASKAGQAALDLESVLGNARPGVGCSSLLDLYQAGLTDYGRMDAHLRAAKQSGVALETSNPGLVDRREQLRKRLMKLDERIRKGCFCKE